MKKIVIAVLAALAIIWAVAAGASAAPKGVVSPIFGPYQGSWDGVVYGDANSQAPLALDLTHWGDSVAGTVTLGEGLYVDGGWCGSGYLPSVTTSIEGQSQRWNPRRLETSPTFDLGGFNLTIDFESTVSADGETINARAKADIPWFCGSDPVLTATFDRN